MSSDNNIDKKKRKFLVRATAAMSVFGAAMAGIPFVASLSPSNKAKALGGPIKVKVDEMKPGDQLTVMWRGRPIWIVRRDKRMLETLKEVTSELRDPQSEQPQQPDYAKNEYRSRKPEFLILVGICTHLGCVPTYRPEPKSISSNWLGGFFCTCHGSKFDLAGRVYKGVPAPLNLEVPPYVLLDDGAVLIGVDKKSRAT